MEEQILTLLIAIMVSQDRIDNGTLVQTMEAFLLIITITMFNMLISISMMITKMHLTMMVHTIMAIKR